MSISARDHLLLVLLSALLFFGRLGAAPLWDRDEPRNAGCTAEMLRRGDYVVPVFNDELRTHKPILLYWAMMASYAVMGINEFGARATSAAAGMGTVLLTYHLARLLFDRRVGVWSGLILASTLMFSVAARAATPDSLLIFCGTLAIYCYVRGTLGTQTDTKSNVPSSPLAEDVPRGFWLFAMYASMGLAVLAKGPVGLILPTAVIGMYLLIVRLPPVSPPSEQTYFRRVLRLLRPFAPLHFLQTCWKMKPLTALLTAGAVALPWYAWVHLRTNGVWTTEFFWIHNVSRASATMEGHSGPPLLFYLVAILAGFFPWSILTIPTSIHAVRSARASAHPTQRNAIVLLACWVGVYVGLFSLAQTKLPSYITPTYPALAIFVGYFMSEWRTTASLPTRWLKIGLAHWIALGVATMVGLPIAAHRWLPGGEWLGVIGLLLVVGGVVSWQLLNARQWWTASRIFAATSVGFVLLVQTVVPAELGRHRNDAELLARIQQHDGPVVSFGHLEPSWIFYSGKSIREFGAGQAAELDAYIQAHARALVVTTDRRMEMLIAQAPNLRSFEVVTQSEYFLRNRELLLLQSMQTADASAHATAGKSVDTAASY